jgi:Zn-dependent protease with chaperone function
MNFFQHQDDARKRSQKLIWMFAGAVVGTTALVYFGIAFGFWWLGVNEQLSIPALTYIDTVIYMPWELKKWILGSTVGVILITTFYKLSILRSYGGQAIVDMFPNKRIQHNAASLEEKRLFNVVEEMAIASGIPMPPVYVLTQEEGINAFAAGYTQSDSVVAVSKGCLEHLDRDELQGVVAHEFSHILNGDVRLNIQITGWLFGILSISSIGRFLMRSMGRRRYYSSSSRRGDARGVIVLIGFLLFVTGFAGYIFGRLIQSALSRQREFLADASAVQFTRNPLGIAGALKKIKDLVAGSAITSGESGSVSHFFFARSSKSVNFFSTHPELNERIRVIAPHVLKLPRYKPADKKKEQEAKESGKDKKSAENFVKGVLIAGEVLSAPQASHVTNTGHITETQKEELVQLDAEWKDRLTGAREFLQDIPSSIHEKIINPIRVGEIPILLALADDIDFWKKTEPSQDIKELLLEMGYEKNWNQFISDAALLAESSPSWRVKILEVAAPALKENKNLEDILELSSELIKFDGRVTLFELLLFAVVYRFDKIHKSKKIIRAELRNENVVLKEKEQIFALARNCQTTDRQSLAVKDLGIDLFQFGRALDRLSLLKPALKEKFIKEVKDICYRDEILEPIEDATLRALSLALDCPEIAFISA